MTELKIGDTVSMRKAHACGGNRWQIVRMGADYKLKCLACGHVILIASDKFRRAVKSIEQSIDTTT